MSSSTPMYMVKRRHINVFIYCFYLFVVLETLNPSLLITSPPTLDEMFTPCEALQVYENALIDSVHHDVDDQVVVMCHVGFVFPDGGDTKSTICQPGGTWSVPIKDCEGLFFWLHTIMSFFI